MPLQQKASVIVVGAGICGAAAAYFLCQRGFEVKLIEASAPAAEATGAADGAVSVASKRPGPMMTAALAGITLYRELAEQGLFGDIFKSRSTFIVAASDVECEVLHAHAEALFTAGVSIDKLTRTQTRDRFPALSPEVRMAVEVKNEGHAIGYQIVHRLLTAANIVVRRNEPVLRFIRSNADDRLAGVETTNGKLFADFVVITAGSGSDKLLNLNGALFPRKGQLLVTERAPRLNAAMPGSIMSGSYLLSKGSQSSANGRPARGLGLVIDPLITGQFLIGGTREDFGDRRTNDLDAVSQILKDAVALVPALADVRLLRSFAGARTAVADGLPLIGPLPGLSNAFVVTGFEGDGICLGPVSGKAIAELIAGKAPSFDLSPFAPARFKDLKVAI
jgi:D-hydroxyproline dehydrogenase subunit beta